jgi:Zn finger protein HypA/HybF involved in hydrogenase expression
MEVLRPFVMSPRAQETRQVWCNQCQRPFTVSRDAMMPRCDKCGADVKLRTLHGERGSE